MSLINDEEMKIVGLVFNEKFDLSQLSFESDVYITFRVIYVKRLNFFLNFVDNL